MRKLQANQIEFNTPGKNQYNPTWLNHFPTIKESLLYLNDIVHQTSLELTNFLNKIYPNIEFLAQNCSQESQIDAKLPLSKMLFHCYPILYGLQQNSQNSYQKALHTFLAPSETLDPATVSDQEKITVAALTFQSLANTKRLPHLPQYNDDTPVYQLHKQITKTIKQHIQENCLELINMLEECKILLCVSPKDNNYLAGIIYRLHGFTHFIQNKLDLTTQS